MNHSRVTGMLAGALLIVALALGVSAGPAREASAQSPVGGWSGAAPAAAGVSLAVWGGGSLVDGVAELRVPRSAWVSSGGSLVGYLVDAPPFVNQTFLSVFPGGLVPAGTPVLVVLGVPSQAPIASVLLGASDLGPGAVVLSDECVQLGTFIMQIRDFDGVAGHLEHRGTRFGYVASEIDLYANAVAARAAIDEIRADPQQLMADFEADEAETLGFVGWMYHDYPSLGDGGFYFEFEFENDVRMGVAVASVRETVVAVMTVAVNPLDLRAATVGLAEVAVARAAQVLATSVLTTEGCTPAP